MSRRLAAAAAGLGSRTLEDCRLARLGLTHKKQLGRLAPSFLMGRTLRQRFVDAVRTSLGRLLNPDSLRPLLWRLVCGRRSNVSEWVAGVDGHGRSSGLAGLAGSSARERLAQSRQGF